MEPIMTITHFAFNNRTIIKYRAGDDIIREAYMGVSIKTAERKFREAHGLKGKKIRKTVFDHADK